MKDYSLSLEEQREFIKGFKEEGQKLTLFLGTGESYVTSVKNKPQVIDKMKKQVERAKKTIGINVRKRNRHIIIEILSMIILLLTGTNLITGLAFQNFLFAFAGNATVNLIIASVVPAVMALTSVRSLTKIKKQTEVIDDFKKNSSFLELEGIINQNIISNQNIMSNVSSKSNDKINSVVKTTGDFSLNELDDIPLKDLLTIKANLVRDAHFESEFGIIDETHTPKITLKPKKKQ